MAKRSLDHYLEGLDIVGNEPVRNQYIHHEYICQPVIGECHYCYKSDHFPFKGMYKCSHGICKKCFNDWKSSRNSMKPFPLRNTCPECRAPEANHDPMTTFIPNTKADWLNHEYEREESKRRWEAAGRIVRLRAPTRTSDLHFDLGRSGRVTHAAMQYPAHYRWPGSNGPTSRVRAPNNQSFGLSATTPMGVIGRGAYSVGNVLKSLGKKAFKYGEAPVYMVLPKSAKRKFN